MTFQQQVLDIAAATGIDGVFFEGTLFFSPDDVTIGMVDSFRDTVESALQCKVQFSDVGDEIAVDFAAG